MGRYHQAVRNRVPIISQARCFRLSDSEHIIAILNSTMMIGQLVASFGFYPSKSPQFYLAAVYIFGLVSIFGMIIAIRGLIETHNAQRKMNELELENSQREIQENGLYFIGNVLYVIGSWLFLPKDATDVHKSTAGAWCYLIGSLMFAMAAFVNALGVAICESFGHRKLMKQLQVANLATSLLASMLYAIGCFGFFPSIASQACSTKWSAIVLGTDFFVAGSFIYCLSAFINHAIIRIKQGTSSATAAATP